MRLTVIGAGHLGATHAASMAEIGHDVVGVDIDDAKVDILNSGKGWFHEPDLDDLLERNISAGRLRFTTDFSEAAKHGDVHFLAVGTPAGVDGHYDMSQLTGAVEKLAPHFNAPTLIIGKSTVTPGTAEVIEKLARQIAPDDVTVEVAWNPEFLREGSGVADTLTPDRIVIGVESESAESILRHLYDPITSTQQCPLIVTNRTTAEMVKATANAYLATRLSFVNAVSEMCASVGADVRKLAEAIGYDARIGHLYLAPGLGFGGGCLPKDLQAFTKQAGVAEVESAVALLAAVDAMNNHMRHRAVTIIKDLLGEELNGMKIALWGATFKPGVDDVRDSPALWLAEQLKDLGAEVTVFDPQGLDQAMQSAPTLKFSSDALTCAADADIIVIGTAWPQFASVEPSDVSPFVRRKAIFDTRGIISGKLWRDHGWSVATLGYSS